MAVKSRRLSVLLHHVAVLRRRRRVPMSCLRRGLRYPVFREALLRIRLRRLIWSVHPTLASQRGFWERNVLGKWRDTARKYARRAHFRAVYRHAYYRRLSTSLLRPNVTKRVVVNANTLQHVV